MQIQNTLGNLYGKSSSILPWNIIVKILKIWPKWTLGTMFKNDTVMRMCGYGLKFIKKELRQGT